MKPKFVTTHFLVKVLNSIYLIMKTSVILIFTFFYVQTSASLYERFRGAVSNVERGFDKLINDVVIDVKDTLHCTISAVAQVLVKNGLLEETSDYNSRCRGYSKPKTPKSRGYGFRSFFKERIKNVQSTHLSPELELKHTSKKVDASVINVNSEILRRRDVNSNFLMKDGTDHLNAVSDLLKREFENLSINVRNEILKHHNGIKKHSRHTIWEDLKAMHYFKSNSKNKTDINKISDIIDKVVNKLQVPTSNKVLSENEKLEEIKKHLNKYKSKKQNDQTTVFNAKDIVETKISRETEIESLKDLKQNIYNNKKVITDNKTDQVFQEEAVPQGANAAAQGSNAENSLFGVNMAAMDNSPSSFYNPTPFSKIKKIVEDAKTIMDESKKSEELLNHFFEEQHSNADIFSSGHLFNF